MKVNDLIMNKLSEKKSTGLWLQLRKDSAKFDDLCETRDSYVRMLEPPYFLFYSDTNQKWSGSE